MNTSQLLHFKNLFDPWASWDSGQQINPCSDRPRRCFNMSWHSLRFTERPWCSCWAIQLFQKPDQNVVLFWWFWNQSEVTLLIFLLAIWNETFRVCKYEVSTIIDEQTLRELQGKLDTLDKFQVTIWRDLVYDPPIQRKCSSNWTTTSVVIECPWNPLPSNCIAGATGRIWPVFTSVFLIETGIGKVIIEKWIWFKSTRLLVTYTFNILQLAVMCLLNTYDLPLAQSSMKVHSAICTWIQADRIHGISAALSNQEIGQIQTAGQICWWLSWKYYRLITRWWFQPIWKILVKLDPFPK